MAKRFAPAGKFLGRPPHKVRRSIQQDEYSCGAHVCLTALRVFRKTKIPSIPRLIWVLGTDEEWGTDDWAIAAYLRTRNIPVEMPRTLRWKELRHAIAKGKLVIATVDGEDHYVVVHGVDDQYVYLSDPSENRCPGRTQTIREFQARYDKFGIIVGR